MLTRRHQPPPIDSDTSDEPTLDGGYTNSLDTHAGGPLVISPDHEALGDTVALQESVGYQQKLIAETSARLDTAQEEIRHLQQRLTQLEVFAHKLHENQSMAREMAERQTRYSALDLAIKASPGGDGAQMTALAEGFLAWLRGVMH